MQACFNSFTITMTMDQARGASHQGACDADVAAMVADKKIRRQLDRIIERDPCAIRQELSGYGAWDDAELADHEQNLHRIVWVAAGNIVEESKA